MANYTTPGVYVEEVSTLPPSVAEVSTAVPVFIGYTEKSGDLLYKPVKISTLLEFEQLFGKGYAATFQVTTKTDEKTKEEVITEIKKTSADKYLLYYSLKLFFDNGGGACYIISTGDFTTQPTAEHFTKALDSLKTEDEPTLILLTDAISLGKEYYNTVCTKALAQCEELGDRFLIVDVIGADTVANNVGSLRASDGIGMNSLKYGAAYAPYLQTTIPYIYREEDVTWQSGNVVVEEAKPITYFKVSYTGSYTSPKAKITKQTGDTTSITFAITASSQTLNVTIVGDKSTGKDVVTAWEAWKATNGNDAKGFSLSDGTDTIITATTSLDVVKPGESKDATVSKGSLASIKNTSTALYNKIKTLVGGQRITLPPSGAVAGLYAKTDRERGVWKAPANASLASVLGPVAKISDKDQQDMNVDATAGKSVNAIRAFTGKGTLVWGARTLAGNDNEWRYVSVRRLFNLIEESVKKSTAFAVFEPNDSTTWLKVKAMIDSYLYGLWQQGALAGATPDAAYYINVGLGKTMTSQDVLEGRLIVEIGVAAVRPAEFIVLRFMHKLQES